MNLSNETKRKWKWGMRMAFFVSSLAFGIVVGMNNNLLAMEAESTDELRDSGVPRGDSPNRMEAESTDELMAPRDSASGQSTGIRQGDKVTPGPDRPRFGGEDQGDNIQTGSGTNTGRQQGPPSVKKNKGLKGRKGK